MCGVGPGVGKGMDDGIAWRVTGTHDFTSKGFAYDVVDVGSSWDLVWKRTEEESWFWSIDAIAGEHHLPVKINGPLQKDIWA
ncbi:hypothetical protein CDAR_315271 [Caerostris darwini]|uniref:Uncharacterized protein n=1 Tax=Caerostris darwini TaxID=1538125 RepID=A0AAV4W8U8_9ARAC|nr:hypothetical protein CDAR_315271 [Caerostris darwini]